MKNVFLIECSAPHWLPITELLLEQGVRVAYWTAWQHAKDKIIQTYSEDIFHDTRYAKMGLNAEGTEEKADAFDSACEHIWQTEAQTIYDQMNRFDHSRDMRHIERSLLFYRILVFWRKKLSSANPDLVIFPAPPHVVYDYVLLCLCRILNVKTLMFEEVTIYPPYSLAMADYVTGSRELSAAVDAKPIPSQESLNLAKKLRGDYLDAKPLREIIAHKARDDALHAGVHALRDGRENARARERSGIDLKLVNQSSIYKERGKTLRNSFLGKYAGTRYYQQLIWEWFETKHLQRVYDSYVSDDLSVPSIYVPLAGQPERTTNPQADMYTQQLLMVNALAHAVPSGWRVWVKEHPNQFHPQFAANMCRSTEFYMALRSLKNVQIVPCSHDPFTLVDRSALVATTGGTTGLEAIARGRQVLLFGHAWYRDCPGVYRVSTAQDVCNLLNAPNFSDTTIVNSDFESYLEAVKSASFRGIADYPPDGYPMVADENIKSLVQITLNRIYDQLPLCGVS